MEGEGETGEGETPLKDTYVFSMHGHASRFNAATLDKAHSRHYGEAGNGLFAPSKPLVPLKRN